jgi:hypothetical protein
MTLATTKVIEGRVRPADKAASPYLYLPFEVPEGTTRIDVRYAYDAGNILDLGVVDATLGPFPSRQGFRGWSGDARRSFFVARDGATPGYIPGEMPPGTWRVMLGLYRIKPEGCAFRVEVMLDRSPRLLVAPAPAFTTLRSEARWFRGDLHSHTHHSDARGSLSDLVRAAKGRGLDFLAVTDHNTYSHHRFLAEAGDPDLLLLPGQEITTERGHANAWGVEGWVDFRILADDDVSQLVREVQDRGGVFSVNHPKETGPAWHYPIPDGIDCLEVWQAPWAYRNWEALARYDALLALGRRLTLVGGSDRHQPGWPDPDPELLWVGTPTTWLYLEELSVPAVLKALREGQAFVTEGPAGPTIDLQVMGTGMGGTVRHRAAQPLSATATVKGAAGDALRWVTAAGVMRETAVTGEIFSDTAELMNIGPFVRLEVIDRTRDKAVRQDFAELASLNKLPPGLALEEIMARGIVRCLSNPVYVQSTKAP